MENVLVYGAAGFVGTSLLPTLVSRGLMSLLLVDRNPIHQEICARMAGMGATVHTLVSDHILGLPGLERVTKVVCLAGATSVDAALSQPAPAMRDNLAIAVDLAEWLRTREGSVRTVYVSSDEVLGESRTPLKEDAPLNPTQPYAASKAAAEIIIRTFRDTYKLDISLLRSCNLIGAGQKKPKLLPVAVHCLLQDKPVPIHGTGRQEREWMAVEDFCNAIAILLDESCPGGVYQAATGVHFSVLEVVEIVCKAIDKPMHLHHVADRLVQDRCYAMTSDKLRSLGWAPQVEPTFAITSAARALRKSFLQRGL